MSASVVFLRGVNVGGHKTFKPAALARDLANLDAVNIGAAGTYVIRKPVGPAALRAELLRRLPFQPEIMICPARDVLRLAQAAPFAEQNASAEAVRYVSILTTRPRTVPPLPIRRPDSDQWQVCIFAATGRFVLSLHRRMGKTLIYPNEVVEKSLGIPATTRNWNTIETVCSALEAG